MDKVSPKQLTEIFFSIENRFQALDKSIQKIKIWQLLRTDLYYLIASKYAIEEQGHSKISKKNTIKAFFSYIKNSFIKNPFFMKKCEIIIFPHSRSKEVDGKKIDIYTHYFLEKLKQEDVNFVEIEIAALGEHQRVSHKRVAYADFIILLTKIFKYFVPIKLTKDECGFIDDLNNVLKTSLDAKVNLSPFLLNGIKIYKIKYFLYKRLFKKLSPKKLYIVPAYGNGVIVKAAKDLGIRVVELQHGVFSHYHLGYSYPKRQEELDYFPDEFLVWNSFWKDLMTLPLADENIKIKPFEFLEKYKIEYSDVEKFNQIVVLSQGNIGNKLAGLLLDNLMIYKKFKIIYKLHPGEYDRYDTYKNLRKLQKIHGSIEIVKEVDLYALLASSKYQLGINSTALFEGIEFGCKTILLNTDGIEYMNKFIEVNALIKVDGMYVSSDIIKDFSI